MQQQQQCLRKMSPSAPVSRPRPRNGLHERMLHERRLLPLLPLLLLLLLPLPLPLPLLLLLLLPPPPRLLLLLCGGRGCGGAAAVAPAAAAAAAGICPAGAARSGARGTTGTRGDLD